MSGDPIFGFTGQGEQSFKVIQTDRSPNAPYPGLILQSPGEGRRNERSVLADLRQIVALMWSHRSVFAGFLLIAILFLPLLK